MTSAALWVPIVMTLAMGAAAEAGDEKTGRVNRAAPSIEFKPQVVMSGDDVIVLVRITPDRMSRLLSVALESPSYYASTERQLRGEDSPRMHRFTWRTLPANRYLVTVELRDAVGTVQSADQVLTVHGPGQSDCATDSGVVGPACPDAAPIGAAPQ